VKMQGEMQRWVDHSISVTVNLPNSISEEMVAKVYQTAWESGCKGITVYRDGSRDGVLVSADGKKSKEAVLDAKRQRPDALDADIIRFKNGNEDWIAFVQRTALRNIYRRGKRGRLVAAQERGQGKNRKGERPRNGKKNVQP